MMIWKLTPFSHQPKIHSVIIWGSKSTVLKSISQIEKKKIWNELILFTIYSRSKCGNFNQNVKISLTLKPDILNSIVKHCANPNPSATLLLPEGFKECMSMHPLWNSQQLILWKVLGSSSKYISTKKSFL